MSKANLATFLKSAKTTLAKHSPQILTGLGIAGMVTTTVLAVRATPKAIELIEDRKRELYPLDDEGELSLPVMETVKAAWKPYIPAAVTGVVSIACLIGANSVSTRRTAALAAAYQLSESALSEYREKVVETIGEKKEQVVREKVAEEKIKKNPVSKNEVVITEKGNTLCFDPLSSRYFKSDLELIRRAQNNINAQLLNGIGGSATLNDFYDEIGLKHTDMGQNVGWNAEYRIDIDITSHIADDGTPCIVVDHYNPPKYNFD